MPGDLEKDVAALYQKDAPDQLSALEDQNLSEQEAKILENFNKLAPKQKLSLYQSLDNSWEFLSQLQKIEQRQNLSPQNTKVIKQVIRYLSTMQKKESRAEKKETKAKSSQEKAKESAWQKKSVEGKESQEKGWKKELPKDPHKAVEAILAEPNNPFYLHQVFHTQEGKVVFQQLRSKLLNPNTPEYDKTVPVVKSYFMMMAGGTQKDKDTEWSKVKEISPHHTQENGDSIALILESGEGIDMYHGETDVNDLPDTFQQALGIKQNKSPEESWQASKSPDKKWLKKVPKSGMEAFMQAMEKISKALWPISAQLAAMLWSVKQAFGYEISDYQREQMVKVQKEKMNWLFEGTIYQESYKQYVTDGPRGSRDYFFTKFAQGGSIDEEGMKSTLDGINSEADVYTLIEADLSKQIDATQYSDLQKAFGPDTYQSFADYVRTQTSGKQDMSALQGSYTDPWTFKFDFMIHTTLADKVALIQGFTQSQTAEKNNNNQEATDNQSGNAPENGVDASDDVVDENADSDGQNASTSSTSWQWNASVSLGENQESSSVEKAEDDTPKLETEPAPETLGRMKKGEVTNILSFDGEPGKFFYNNDGTTEEVSFNGVPVALMPGRNGSAEGIFAHPSANPGGWRVLQIRKTMQPNGKPKFDFHSLSIPDSAPVAQLPLLQAKGALLQWLTKNYETALPQGTNDIVQGYYDKAVKQIQTALLSKNYQSTSDMIGYARTMLSTATSDIVKSTEASQDDVFMAIPENLTNLTLWVSNTVEGMLKAIGVSEPTSKKAGEQNPAVVS